MFKWRDVGTHFDVGLQRDYLQGTLDARVAVGQWKSWLFEGGRLQQREQQAEGGGEAAEECRTSLCQGPRPNTLWVMTHLLPAATPHACCLLRVFLAVSEYGVLNPVCRWDRAKCSGYTTWSFSCIPPFHGIWHPKVKIQSSSPPLHADGRSGEVLGQQSPQNISGASTTEVVRNCKKKKTTNNITWLHTARVV